MTTCFFFNDTATTEIYTLSLHDALPIFGEEVVVTVPFVLLVESNHEQVGVGEFAQERGGALPARYGVAQRSGQRSEEHTFELQSRQYLVCRLLLEKKKI